MAKSAIFWTFCIACDKLNHHDLFFMACRKRCRKCLGVTYYLHSSYLESCINMKLLPRPQAVLRYDDMIRCKLANEIGFGAISDTHMTLGAYAKKFRNQLPSIKASVPKLFANIPNCVTISYCRHHFIHSPNYSQFPISIPGRNYVFGELWILSEDTIDRCFDIPKGIEEKIQETNTEFMICEDKVVEISGDKKRIKLV